MPSMWYILTTGGYRRNGVGKKKLVIVQANISLNIHSLWLTCIGFLVSGQLALRYLHDWGLKFWVFNQKLISVMNAVKKKEAIADISKMKLTKFIGWTESTICLNNSFVLRKTGCLQGLVLPYNWRVHTKWC